MNGRYKFQPRCRRDLEERVLKRTLARWIGVLVVACLLWPSPQPVNRVQAAGTASSRYDVQVHPVLRGRLRIFGPPVTTITHDGTNNNQVFGIQQWDVHSNARRGASVTFETTHAFRKTGGGPPVKRDARIQLGIARQEVAANWAVTSAASQTNYAAGNEVAVVSAISSDPGDVTFNVQVTFLETDFSTLRAGTYSTTVVGTITANR